MKTENEARKCWCPFSRVEGSNRVIVDLGVHNSANRCIGSECMAWRWGQYSGGGLDHLEIASGVSLALSTAGIRSAQQLQAMTDPEIMRIPRIGTSGKMQIRNALKTFFQRPPVQSVGYCGLAGKP